MRHRVLVTATVALAALFGLAGREPRAGAAPRTLPAVRAAQPAQAPRRPICTMTR